MLENWTFTLFTKAGVQVASGTTNASGKLVFSDLVPGDYYVTETLTSGWRNTTPLTQNVTVVANTTSSAIGAACETEVAALWFGNVPEDEELGDLKVYKYLDETRTGV